MIGCEKCHQTGWLPYPVIPDDFTWEDDCILTYQGEWIRCKCNPHPTQDNLQKVFENFKKPGEVFEEYLQGFDKNFNRLTADGKMPGVRSIDTLHWLNPKVLKLL